MKITEPDLLESPDINSRQDFVVFLHQLLADYQKNGQKWENKQLSDFLGALAAYAADIHGPYQNMSKAGTEVVVTDAASWHAFADMLRGATIYE